MSPSPPACVLCPLDAPSSNPNFPTAHVISAYALGTILVANLGDDFDSVPYCEHHSKVLRALSPTIAILAEAFVTIAAARTGKSPESFAASVAASRTAGFPELRKALGDGIAAEGKAPPVEEVLGEGVARNFRKAAEAMGVDAAKVVSTTALPAWDAERASQLAELFLDIHGETEDDDPRDLVLRAMACYRSFVRHARAGGQVKFVGVGAEKTLKVRLRKKETP